MNKACQVSQYSTQLQLNPLTAVTHGIKCALCSNFFNIFFLNFNNCFVLSIEKAYFSRMKIIHISLVTCYLHAWKHY